MSTYVGLYGSGLFNFGSYVSLPNLFTSFLGFDILPMTCSQIITIAKDVTSALNYLHLWKPHPILHQVVQMSLLEPSGSSRWKGKLSDYRSANILHQIHTVASGTPAYAAPET